MHRLSSQWTIFNKRIFPVIWFGFLATFFVIPFIASKTKPVPLPFFIMPFIMAGFGFFIMKKLIFGLVDEVWEDGNALVVKNKGIEERILFSEIKNVNCSVMTNPQRITLSLRVPSKFGSEISFCPLRQFSFFPNFSINPIAMELIDKVDRARQS
jgi:hypothetical protein